MKKNLEWAKAAFIRAFKTFVQSGTSLLTTAVVLSDIDPLLILQTAGLAFITSLITSTAGLPELGEGTENKVKAALIRCVKTMAQTALSYVATMTMINEVDWIRVTSASAVAGLISLGMNFKADKLPEVLVARD